EGLRLLPMAHDQARAGLFGDIGPHPLNEHGHAKAGLREKPQVHSGPGEECGETAHLHAAALENGEVPADDRHVPFIEIPEWSGRGARREAPLDRLRDMASLLYFDLRNTWQWSGVLLARRDV